MARHSLPVQPLYCRRCRKAGRDASKVRAVDLGNQRKAGGVAHDTVAVRCETCEHAWNSTHPTAKVLRKQLHARTDLPPHGRTPPIYGGSIVLADYEPGTDR